MEIGRNVHVVETDGTALFYPRISRCVGTPGNQSAVSQSAREDPFVVDGAWKWHFARSYRLQSLSTAVAPVYFGRKNFSTVRCTRKKREKKIAAILRNANFVFARVYFNNRRDDFYTETIFVYRSKKKENS